MLHTGCGHVHHGMFHAGLTVTLGKLYNQRLGDRGQLWMKVKHIGVRRGVSAHKVIELTQHFTRFDDTIKPSNNVPNGRSTDSLNIFPYSHRIQS